jgi:hypothetical protein
MMEACGMTHCTISLYKGGRRISLMAVQASISGVRAKGSVYIRIWDNRSLRNGRAI